MRILIYMIILTLRTSEAGIPALRMLSCGVESRYTGGTVCQRLASEAGIPALFANAYWHLNARVIETQTRQQLKIIVPMKHSEFLCTGFAFGHLAANVRVRCSDFQSYVSMLYIRNDIRHLCLAKFCDGGL